jgi:cytochrome b6-f complex iron-sulfur subunit
MPIAPLSRRRFVKTFALGTAWAVVAGKPWRATVLAEGSPAPNPQTATFQIHPSEYPALGQPLGSVRLGVNPVRPEVEPFPDGDFWPFLVNRGENDAFYVLDCECRHASCVVPPYDPCTSGIHCPCHGSTYDIDGSVLSGPTQFPLRRYAFEFDGDDTLTIHVPGLGFSVGTSVVSNEINARLALTFPTHPSVQYQVHFRPNLAAPWTLILFATTPEGSPNQDTLFAGGLTETVYVDRTTALGFYAVAMVLSEV